jgi:DNA (cytosine-5)-methyltransferase 1
MAYFGKTKVELRGFCDEKGLKYKKSDSNDMLTKLLNGAPVNTIVTVPLAVPVATPVKKPRAKKASLVTPAVAIPVATPVVATAVSNLRMIDLFAGTGAFTYAFQGTGKVQCVFANDMVESSKKIYDENYDHKLTLKDLNEVKVEDIPPHDILTGGFPCQPFSLAGRQEGFQDPRSNVFWKILQIIDYHNPKCVVLENVKNLVSHDDGNTFKTIKESLEGRGYYIRFKVLNTAQITGIPQHRERIYLVCLKSKEAFDKFSLDFPNVAKGPVSSCFSEAVADKYYYTNASSTWDLVSQNVLKKNTIYQYRRVYVRENKSNECPTLTANMGGGGHNVPLIKDDKGIRKLTPRECFNFQGFPQTYKLPALADSNLYKLSGNAVSVPVVKLIAERLMALL